MNKENAKESDDSVAAAAAIAGTTSSLSKSNTINSVADENPVLPADDYALPIPPDGGWGWAVVVAAFFSSLIVDGVCYTFGIFSNDLMDHFQSSKGETALVGSMLTGMYNIVGPVVSGLANKFGCRKVAIFGSALATISFILSTFSNNITTMTIIYGVMGGIGFGFMYLPAIVMVGFYFDKKRAMATGIAVCGSGIGTFVFAPLGTMLVEEYGWKGTNIILAGIILNGIVCGAVFRPLVARPVTSAEQSKIMKSIVAAKKRNRTTSTGSMDGAVITRDNKLIKEQIALVGATVDTIPEEEEDEFHNEDGEENETTEDKPAQSIVVDETSTPKASAINIGGSNVGSLNIAGSTVGFSNVGGSNVWGSNSGSAVRHKRIDSLRNSEVRPQVYISNNSIQRSIRSTAEEEERVEKRKKEMSSPFARQDIFYSGSITSLPEYKANPDMDTYVQSVTSLPYTAVSYPEDGVCVRGARILENMFDFSLLTSPTFVVVCLSGVFAFAGLYTPFVYVAEKAMSLGGISKSKASLIISILGVFNTIGRLLAGFLADQKWSDSLVIHNVSVILAGLLTCLVPILNTYELLCIYAALFGLFMAAFIALRSIVMVELLGIQKLTSAFGLTALFQGLVILGGSPLSGIILEKTGSFTGPFLVSGSLFILGGLICLPARRLAKWEAKRAEARMQVTAVDDEI